MESQPLNQPHDAPRGRSLILWGVGIALVGIIVFLGFKFLLPMFEPKHEEAAPVASVQELPATRVVSSTLSRTDQLPGEILAYQDVAIYPKVPGFIELINIDRGSIVKKGQLMVRMFAPEFLAARNEAFAKAEAARATFHESESKLQSARAQLLETKAKLLGDDSTYQRLKAASLVPGVVATNDVVVLGETVQADRERVKSWEANVKASANQVAALADTLTAARRAADDYKDIADYLEITAPFDGYITERNMHVGSFVGPLGKGAYAPIVRIQQLDLLRVVAPVPETETGGVLPGARVEFSVSTHPGERFVGEVARLGNYLEQKTRTMPVELNYWNKGNRILPGMFCEVYWPTRRPRPSLFVPTSAVCSTTQLTFVCRVRDGVIEWVKVKPGLTMNNLIEVFGDLKEGDLVAVQGTDELREGTHVSPKEISTEESAKPKPPRPVYHYH